MKTIEERASNYCEQFNDSSLAFNGYIQGATDQKKIDINKACEWIINTPMYAKQPNQLVEEFRKAMEE